MLDSNTYYLNDYEHQQDIAEREYYLSLGEKYYDVIDYAIEIMSGKAHEDDFHMAFSRYYCEDEGEYFPHVLTV